MNNKMEWLINIINTGIDTRSDLVKSVNEDIKKSDFGVIKAPTGIGKSGIIYMDIANRIKENKKKKVFIISTPLLVLNDQFFTDLVSTLYGAKLIVDTNTIVANNSSDEEQKEGVFDEITKIKKCSVENAIKLFKHGKIYGHDLENVFIISTHKSFNKLNNALKEIKNIDNTVEIIAYLDEEHTFKFNPNDNLEIELNDEDSGFIDILKFKDIITNLYTFSATPRKSNLDIMTNIFNNGLISCISTADAIRISHDILDVYADCVSVTNKNDVKYSNDVIDIWIKNKEVPYIKCLETCSTVEELEEFRDYFVKKGKTVFYTTARTGKWCWTKNGEKIQYKNITAFTEEIKKIEEDIVVLHIRQMIAGIDVSALTHCIIRNIHNDVRDTTRMIQTIGRVLRYYNNVERCNVQMNVNDYENQFKKLTKKYGHVCFLINDDADKGENLRYLDRFLNTEYKVGLVNCYDIKSYASTGAKKNERLDTPYFNKTKDEEYSLKFEKFIFNEAFIKEIAANGLCDRYQLIEELKIIFEEYISNLNKSNDSIDIIESQEFDFKIKDRFNEIYDKIVNMYNIK